MLQPTSPFRVPYTLTQGYDSKSSMYASGYHHAWDMLPEGRTVPEYYVLPGKLIGKQDYPKAKQVDVSTELDAPMISYFKAHGFIPRDYMGPVFMKHSYLHMLNIVQNLGDSVTQDDSMGICGNLGMVSTGGVAVPPNMIGVAPYPGLHLHFEYSLNPNDTSHPFNLDKDIIGRIEPLYLFNYPFMNEAKIVKSKTSPTVYVCYPVPSMEYLGTKATLEGFVVPTNIPDSDSL